MSWWEFGAAPERGGPGGAAASGPRRSRPFWLAAAGGAVVCAAIAGFAFWRVSTGGPAGPSWAPAPRRIGGLRAVAAASRTQYSLYTAHGAVHFLPGVDLGATTPGHLPGNWPSRRVTTRAG